MNGQESQTWGDLITRHWGRLRAQVHRSVRREDAEDLLHDAWIGIATSQAAVRNPSALIVHAAANRGRDAFRRERRAGETTPVESMADSLADLAPLQDEVLIARHRLERLRLGVEQLKPRTRQVLLMHRIEGLKYREIAAALGISQSAVEKHIAQAMASLNDWMEDW